MDNGRHRRNARRKLTIKPTVQASIIVAIAALIASIISGLFFVIAAEVTSHQPASPRPVIYVAVQVPAGKAGCAARTQEHGHSRRSPG